MLLLIKVNLIFDRFTMEKVVKYALSAMRKLPRPPYADQIYWDQVYIFISRIALNIIP